MKGHVLHDWDLDQKKRLIRKAFDALPADGSLIVYESIIDDERRQNTFGLLMSLNMLIETPSGFDYTGRDCAGFAEPTLNIWQVPTQWWLGLNRRPARVCGCSCPLYPRKRTSIK